jgi:hypothetical protein
VSSFLPSYRASFNLTVRSSLPIQVTPISAEGAGLYSRLVRGSWSTGKDGGKDDRLRNPRFRLRCEKAATVRFVPPLAPLLYLLQRYCPHRLRLVLPSEPKPIALFVYTSTADGEPDKPVYSTLPYADPVCGVILDNAKLDAREQGPSFLVPFFPLLTRLSPPGYVVVPSTYSGSVHVDFHILLFADVPITFS